LESLMETIDEQVAAVEQAFLVSEPPNPAP
jgi:hypothetical protein